MRIRGKFSFFQLILNTSFVFRDKVVNSVFDRIGERHNHSDEDIHRPSREIDDKPKRFSRDKSGSRDREPKTRNFRSRSRSRDRGRRR